VKKILIFFLIVLQINKSFADNYLEISGIYQGENLYVMNPFTPIGIGFCIYEITINEQISTDEINSSAFEIDLSSYNLEIGNSVKIVIKYKNDCSPTVINAEVLKPRATFVCANLVIGKDGTMKWTTTEERGELPFIIEQFKWNKWVKVTEVTGKGTSQKNSYSCKVEFTSGQNKFRIKQIDYTNKPRYSSDVTFNNLAAKVTFAPGDGKQTSSKITFSAKTSYEIYDNFGNLKLKGNDISIDISKLAVGIYFINYDNTTETFEKVK